MKTAAAMRLTATPSEIGERASFANDPAATPAMRRAGPMRRTTPIDHPEAQADDELELSGDELADLVPLFSDVLAEGVALVGAPYAFREEDPWSERDEDTVVVRKSRA